MVAESFYPDQILSMTELQKLSLRRLRKMNLAKNPLLVMGKKPERHAFVILDYKAYVHLCTRLVRPKSLTAARWLPALNSYDFACRGLFWDTPQMTNQRFVRALKYPADPQHDWAISRFLERLPSQQVLRLGTVMMVARLLERAKVRPPIRKAWEHAMDYWRQTP